MKTPTRVTVCGLRLMKLGPAYVCCQEGNPEFELWIQREDDRWSGTAKFEFGECRIADFRAHESPALAARALSRLLRKFGCEKYLKSGAK